LEKPKTKEDIKSASLGILRGSITNPPDSFSDFYFNQLFKENENEMLTCVFSEQKTPLHLCAQVGNESIASFLIKKGCNLNAVDQVSVLI
jgi:ankyrin repeat protein